MTRKIFAALLFSLFTLHLSPLRAEDVVRLESAVGTGSEYNVAEMLRVELKGDSIRFVKTDGSVAAEVYKYDYVKLTVAGKEITAVPEQAADSRQPMARKVIMNGQVYILFGDKAYLISGTGVK